jgi:PTH1 family peptidyl-tRNA hydrolase
MKLVVGLGNPGRKYQGTRHNVGFQVLREIARRREVGRLKSRFGGEIAEASIDGESTVLLWPLTFMNLSGQCVQMAVDYYGLSLGDLLVICDDFNLPLARLRFRPGGSAGGHNGLNDIIRRLGSQFNRLRIGIGVPPPQWDVADFVTGRFDPMDQPVIDTAVIAAADAAEYWISAGIQSAMNRYNGEPQEDKSARLSGKQPADDDGQAHGPQSKPKIDND